MAFVVGGNQLYSRASADYGGTWGPAVRVLDATDTSAAYKPQLRVVGDSLYLGWIGTHGTAGDVWGFSRRRVPRDGKAVTWAAPMRSPPLPGTLVSATFAVNGCGDIRAFAEIVSPRSEAVVRELMVRDGRVDVSRPFGDAFTIAPLTDRAGDRIIQLWNAVRAPIDSVQPFFREFSTCR